MNKNLNYDKNVILIGKTVSQNSEHQDIKTDVKTTILCKEKSVSRNEFYKARQDGYKRVKVLVIHEFEYNNEEEAIYNGNRYKILKDFDIINNEEIEITLVSKAGIKWA